MNLQYLAIIALLIIIIYYVFVRKTDTCVSSTNVGGYWDLTKEIDEFNKIQKKCINKFSTIKTL